MTERKQRYLSYLLRLWQVRDAEGWTWRASLESTATSDRRGFVSIEELFGFLCHLTQETGALSSRKGSRR